MDRSGLEAAIALGLEQGGWCPKGRLSEDGSIPSRYSLTETETADYPTRTEKNVIDSDATLILYEEKLRGGTLLTFKLTKQWHRPCLCLNLASSYASDVRLWLDSLRPDVLNVAGPRESSHPGIEQRGLDFLLQAFCSEFAL